MVGYLPQRLDILDESLSVVENLCAAAPGASVNAVRASLARFLFRGARADKPAGHDLHFLRSVGITRWLRLDRATGLREMTRAVG